MTDPTPKKRTNKSKPVQRSLQSLRENGWEACVVEKWIPPRGSMKFGVRVDAFGFGDILACRPETRAQCPACRGAMRIGRNKCPNCLGRGLVVIGNAAIALVQCCSTDAAAHKAKILAIPEFYIWKRAGGLVFLQAWKFGGPRGETKHWHMKEETL